jgi:hypothetical protein
MIQMLDMSIHLFYNDIWLALSEHQSATSELVEFMLLKL